MSSADDVISTLEPTSYNLIILFFIEFIIFVIASIIIIIYRNLLPRRAIWITSIIVLLTIIILGIFVVQDPNNTPSDITMFTLDLVILPGLLFIILAGKLIYEQIFQSPSSLPTSGPTMVEKQILREKPSASRK